MSASQLEILEILRERFVNGEFKVIDNMGTGDNWTILVKSQEFKNLPKVKQHQMVMRALKPLLQTKIHAVTIKTS